MPTETIYKQYVLETRDPDGEWHKECCCSASSRRQAIILLRGWRESMLAVAKGKRPWRVRLSS
jgi:hypothetical protein